MLRTSVDVAPLMVCFCKLCDLMLVIWRVKNQCDGLVSGGLYLW